MRVIVTGAGGFIGSHLCERLLSSGEEVIGIDAFTPLYPRKLKEANLAGLRAARGFRLRERDLLDPHLRRDFEGAGAICHLAARAGVRSAAEVGFIRDNMLATEAVVRAAAAAGVRRVVLASSSSVYGQMKGVTREEAPLRPLSAYGRSKRDAELRARHVADGSGLELVILRLFTVYGPRQRPDMAFARFVHAALGGPRMALLGDGLQVRDFTYVQDAVEAIALAVRHGEGGRVYNISGQSTASVGDALARLAAALDRDAQLVPAPADPREPALTAADITCARVELGYEPVVSLDRGIEMQASAALADGTRAATAGRHS
jgi:nucleoside-diphosphate-sugar epimerase